MSSVKRPAPVINRISSRRRSGCELPKVSIICVPFFRSSTTGVMAEQAHVGPIRHFRGQLYGRLEFHAPRLAMAHARGHLVTHAPRLAQVAVLGEKWQIIDPPPPARLILVFLHRDADRARCIIMLLLAGDLASMTPGTIIIIDQNRVPSHGLLLTRRSCSAWSCIGYRQSPICCIAARE